MEALTCAAVAWKVRYNPTLVGWLDHFDELLELALNKGAGLVVFPECIDLERLGPHDPVALLGEAHEEWHSALFDRATRNNLVIVGGSTLVSTDHGLVNRSITVWPDGQATWADKHVLTQFEANEWGLATGTEFQSIRGVGTTVCYDSEFPASSRALCEAGVWIQAVPAFTETKHGFHRVRYACHARAMENQVFVVHASLVGGLGYEPVPSTYGSAAVIAPPCGDFPADGVLAETEPGEEGVAVYWIDPEELHRARLTGDTRNWDDRDKGQWTVTVPTCRHPSE
ncbi:MAG: hypothetical protein JSS65_06870 [Armatimonadetes bacterium]|nr:hypothetical protein [Armatimonadota bacterium]